MSTKGALPLWGPETTNPLTVHSGLLQGLVLRRLDCCQCGRVLHNGSGQCGCRATPSSACPVRVGGAPHSPEVSTVGPEEAGLRSQLGLCSLGLGRELRSGALCRRWKAVQDCGSSPLQWKVLLPPGVQLKPFHSGNSSSIGAQYLPTSPKIAKEQLIGNNVELQQSLTQTVALNMALMQTHTLTSTWSQAWT